MSDLPRSIATQEEYERYCERWDDFDCRPGPSDTYTPTPERLQQTIGDHEAEAHRAAQANITTDGDPTEARSAD
jgi:hypothetical protein